MTFPSHTAPDVPHGQIALFLDIDGTLAPIVPSPHDASIPADTLSCLQALHEATGGAVALVSGRNLTDIDRMSGDAFPAAGQHGLELRMADGTIQRQDADYALIASLTEELMELQAQYPWLLIEPKGLSIAVHYRQVPELKDMVVATLASMAAEHPGLRLQHGKMVCEIRVGKGSKGEAIKRLLATRPFAGKIPVFAGDDLTDEEGFAAVNALGGVTIKIGEGETTARWRMPDVISFGLWLRALLHAQTHQQPLGAL